MNIFTQIQLTCTIIIFLSTVVMNTAKKNTSLVVMYCIQSIALAAILIIDAIQENTPVLILITLLMLLIKVIIAPQIFFRFIRAYKENFSASTYLNVPMTLGMIILLTMFAQSAIFTPLLSFITHISQFRMLVLGSILISLFLTINRKGALSLIIGVLSLENSVFALGTFLGVREAASLEIGILFDILFWVIIASVFIRMLYRHYGTLDVTELKLLQK